MTDFTVVLGVDEKHLKQLAITLPTWARHKPSLLQRRWVVFYDKEQLRSGDVLSVVERYKTYGDSIVVVGWPEQATYEGGDDKWSNAQRYKMLAGFVHIPSQIVTTPYWLKLDTDVVATGMDDWIDEDWFCDEPAIVAPGWGYTKPADQMLKLDDWVNHNRQMLWTMSHFPPLNLHPEPGSNKVCHKRIISWCSFWRSGFTREIAMYANAAAGIEKLPVPSQDGYAWYCAARMQRKIVRANMKRLGWEWKSNEKNIREAVERAMSDDGGS